MKAPLQSCPVDAIYLKLPGGLSPQPLKLLLASGAKGMPCHGPALPVAAAGPYWAISHLSALVVARAHLCTMSTQPVKLTFQS